MNWPNQSFAAMTKFYGKVGENQTRLDLPYTMRLTWEPTKLIRSISCHEKVADSLGRIFQKTLEEYGPQRIRTLRLDHFSGCLNVRRMRGGSAWSIHSWGAAVDIDDERNQLKWGKSKAELAKPEYLPWWRIVEAEGAVSLGRSRNFDWQHFQFATI
jgi:hypothetical protein